MNFYVVTKKACIDKKKKITWNEYGSLVVNAQTIKSAVKKVADTFTARHDDILNALVKVSKDFEGKKGYSLSVMKMLDVTRDIQCIPECGETFFYV